MSWAATAACFPALLLPSPVTPRCSPACLLWPLVSSVSGTAKTPSLAPRYRPFCLTVPNIKFCISLADSLRQNWMNISRIRLQNPGFFPCPLPSLLGYKGSFLFFCFLILQMCCLNWGDRVPKRSEKWLSGSPDAIPGLGVLPWQEEGQSKLIQPEEGSDLCLPLPGRLRWPTTSLFYHLQLKHEEWGSVTYPAERWQPGSRSLFRRVHLKHPGREAKDLHLFQTRP